MPYSKKTNKKPLDYVPTKEEFEAYRWGVNAGWIISPMGIHGSPDEYRIGIATSGNPRDIKRDPATYAHDEVMQKVYEYYKYYYEKREV